MAVDINTLYLQQGTFLATIFVQSANTVFVNNATIFPPFGLKGIYLQSVDNYTITQCSCSTLGGSACVSFECEDVTSGIISRNLFNTVSIAIAGSGYTSIDHSILCC